MNDTLTNDSVEALYGGTTAGYIKAFGLLAKAAQRNQEPAKTPRYTYVDGGHDLHIIRSKCTDAEAKSLRKTIRAIRRERDPVKQKEMLDALPRDKLAGVPIKRAILMDRTVYAKGDDASDYVARARANGSGKGVRQLAIRQAARLQRYANASGSILLQAAE